MEKELQRNHFKCKHVLKKIWCCISLVDSSVQSHFYVVVELNGGSTPEYQLVGTPVLDTGGVNKCKC